MVPSLNVGYSRHSGAGQVTQFEGVQVVDQAATSIPEMDALFSVMGIAVVVIVAMIAYFAIVKPMMRKKKAADAEQGGETQ